MGYNIKIVHEWKYIENKLSKSKVTKTLEVNFYLHVPNLMLFIKLIIEQELPKGDFNWAATGRFFLRGGGSCTHSGYHKTLSPTIA